MGKKSTNFEDMVGGQGTVANSSVEDEQPQGMQISYSNAPSMKNVRPLNLRQAQFMSQAVQDNQAKAGDWLLEGFDPVQEVILVPLGHATPRRFAVGQGDDYNILCQSPDSEVGKGKVWMDGQVFAAHLNPVAKFAATAGPTPDGCHDCATCPFAEWTPNPKEQGKNIGPPCQTWDEFMCWSETHNFPVVLRLTGRTKEARKAPDAVRNLAISKKGFGQFAIRLSSIIDQNPRGRFAVPVVRMTEMQPETKETALGMQAVFLALPATSASSLSEG